MCQFEEFGRISPSSAEKLAAETGRDWLRDLPKRRASENLASLTTTPGPRLAFGHLATSDIDSFFLNSLYQKSQIPILQNSRSTNQEFSALQWPRHSPFNDAGIKFDIDVARVNNTLLPAGVELNGVKLHCNLPTCHGVVDVKC
jgi:hypothetical protein